jgi:hypothetical protein
VQGISYTADTALSFLDKSCHVVYLEYPIFATVYFGGEGIISKGLLTQQTLRLLGSDGFLNSVALDRLNTCLSE